MPRWLVTGGAGFIGSHFIRLSLRQVPDLEIVNLDKLTYAGSRRTLAELNEAGRHRWIHGDVADPGIVRGAMAGCERIIHFAAETHVDRSIQDGTNFVRTNVLGTYTLLEEARRQDVRLFLHVGTDEVYGPIQGDPATETSELAPTNPYSASKAGADLAVLSYFRTHRLPAIVTRSSNNYGPYQYPEKLIPLFITRAMDGKPLPLYGDGAYTRDWLYVEDHARAILEVMEKGVHGEIYNIAGGNEWKNIEVVRLILQILGKDEDLIRHVEDRLAHDRRYAMRADKVRRLGWEPSGDFESGLRETVEWYVSHEAWWREAKLAETAVS